MKTADIALLIADWFEYKRGSKIEESVECRSGFGRLEGPENISVGRWVRVDRCVLAFYLIRRLNTWLTFLRHSNTTSSIIHVALIRDWKYNKYTLFFNIEMKNTLHWYSNPYEINFKSVKLIKNPNQCLKLGN